MFEGTSKKCRNPGAVFDIAAPGKKNPEGEIGALRPRKSGQPVQKGIRKGDVKAVATEIRYVRPGNPLLLVFSMGGVGGKSSGIEGWACSRKRKSTGEGV